MTVTFLPQNSNNTHSHTQPLTVCQHKHTEGAFQHQPCATCTVCTQAKKKANKKKLQSQTTDVTRESQREEKKEGKNEGKKNRQKRTLSPLLLLPLMTKSQSPTPLFLPWRLWEIDCRVCRARWLWSCVWPLWFKFNGPWTKCVTLLICTSSVGMSKPWCACRHLPLWLLEVAALLLPAVWSLTEAWLSFF